MVVRHRCRVCNALWDCDDSSCELKAITGCDNCVEGYVDLELTRVDEFEEWVLNVREGRVENS